MGARRNVFGKMAIVMLAVSVFDAETSIAQSTEDEARDENTLESVLTNSDDLGEVFTPVDINQASEDDLLSIPGVSPECASSIIDFRKRNGFIHGLGEIAHVAGMTAELLSTMRRRTVIVENDRFKAAVLSYFSLSPQRVPLFENTCGEYGILNFQRFDLSYRNFEAYAVTDKDPGERNYLDFYSFSVAARGIFGLSAVNVGDYSVSLGNGLLFSSGGVVSKTAGAITPLFANRAYSLRPYRSKGENKFLRGAALAVPVGSIEITVLGSMKRLDARFDSTGGVTSIDYSGLRLPTSVPRDGLYEQIVGGIIHYTSTTVCAGLSAVHLSYDHPFRNYYSQKMLALESFGRVRTDKMAFSGEVLYDRLVSFSSNASLDCDKVRFAVGMRSLRSRLIQNYSGPVSEGFPANSEQGIYFGTTLRPFDILKLGFYLDRFRMISVSGEPDKNGEEIFVDSYLTLSRKRIFEGSSTILYLRYKYKTKEDSYVAMTDLPAALTAIAGSKQSVRADFRHNFNSAFSLRARFEKNLVSSGERGDLFLFDSAWRLGKGAVDARICFYRTDSYRSAFYSVEKDLPHVAQFMVLYGDGARLFVLGDWKLGSSVAVGMKVSRDLYSRDREVAVGKATRSTAGETEVSMEFRYNIN